MAIKSRRTAIRKFLGQSGCAAFESSATTKGIRLYSAPFAVPWSFEIHVLSVSVRGDWSGRLIVADGKGMCATTSTEVIRATNGNAWNCPSSRSCLRRRTCCD